MELIMLLVVEMAVLEVLVQVEVGMGEFPAEAEVAVVRMTVFLKADQAEQVAVAKYEYGCIK